MGSFQTMVSQGLSGVVCSPESGSSTSEGATLTAAYLQVRSLSTRDEFGGQYVSSTRWPSHTRVRHRVAHRSLRADHAPGCPAQWGGRAPHDLRGVRPASAAW